MITLFSNGCPNCNRLKGLLDEKGIEYKIIDDVDLMISKEFTTVPMLEVDENNIMTFPNAVKWVMEYKGE